MKYALKEAKKAYLKDEVPIGAVIVLENKIIAKAYNQKEKKRDSTCHAEIEVIKKASKKINNWRLNNCSLYVTIEPCPMCAGAIIQSRISRLVFGAENLIYGSFGTVIDLNGYFPDSKNLKIVKGVMKDETANLMRDFFRKK